MEMMMAVTFAFIDTTVLTLRPATIEPTNVFYIKNDREKTLAIFHFFNFANRS
jgi:hypothetical protein